MKFEINIGNQLVGAAHRPVIIAQISGKSQSVIGARAFDSASGCRRLWNLGRKLRCA